MSNCLALFDSTHHGNTERLIQKLVSKFNINSINVNEINGNDNFSQYEIYVFASGVYHGKPSSKILKFIEENATLINQKKVFLVLTSGSKNPKYLEYFKEELSNYGIRTDETYHCLGFDTFGLFKLIGGIAKNHPDEKDMEEICQIFKEKFDV